MAVFPSGDGVPPIWEKTNEQDIVWRHALVHLDLQQPSQASGTKEKLYAVSYGFLIELFLLYQMKILSESSKSYLTNSIAIEMMLFFLLARWKCLLFLFTINKPIVAAKEIIIIKFIIFHYSSEYMEV